MLRGGMAPHVDVGAGLPRGQEQRARQPQRGLGRGTVELVEQRVDVGLARGDPLRISVRCRGVVGAAEHVAQQPVLVEQSSLQHAVAGGVQAAALAQHGRGDPPLGSGGCGAAAGELGEPAPAHGRRGAPLPVAGQDLGTVVPGLLVDERRGLRRFLHVAVGEGVGTPVDRVPLVLPAAVDVVTTLHRAGRVPGAPGVLLRSQVQAAELTGPGAAAGGVVEQLHPGRAQLGVDPLDLGVVASALAVVLHGVVEPAAGRGRGELLDDLGLVVELGDGRGLLQADRVLGGRSGRSR